MPLKRDSKLGKYIIRAQVGEGGMGVVYRARDSVLGRDVAIKTILAHRAGDRDLRLAVQTRGARHLSHGPPKHRHLARFRGSESGDRRASVHGDGVSPWSRPRQGHRKKGATRDTACVDRIVQACGAVSACHRLGYVHRDLKPNNIFLVEYDQIEITKVLDFGAAKAEDRPEGQGGDQLSELTKKGTYIGTPFYMPPELIARGLVTPAADQYALAVVLYQALAGVRPFDYDKEKKELDEVELLRTIVNGQYKPLREHRREVPEGLAAVIKKGMEVKPSNRYLDLHAFGGALLRWASPEISLMWEKHFTSSAPAKIDPKMSIALLVPPERTSDRESSVVIEGATNIDSTVPPLEGPHNTSPTVQWWTRSDAHDSSRDEGTSAGRSERGDHSRPGPEQPAFDLNRVSRSGRCACGRGIQYAAQHEDPASLGRALAPPGRHPRRRRGRSGPRARGVHCPQSRQTGVTEDAVAGPRAFRQTRDPAYSSFSAARSASGRTDCCSRAGGAPEPPSGRRGGARTTRRAPRKAAGAQAPQATDRRQKRYRHSV